MKLYIMQFSPISYSSSSVGATTLGGFWPALRFTITCTIYETIHYAVFSNFLLLSTIKV